MSVLVKGKRVYPRTADAIEHQQNRDMELGNEPFKYIADGWSVIIHLDDKYVGEPHYLDLSGFIEGYTARDAI